MCIVITPCFSDYIRVDSRETKWTERSEKEVVLQSLYSRDEHEQE